DVRSRSELPAEAEAYLSLIEEQVGVPIGMVGVGPGRDQVIQFGNQS
ncbi:MAG TPA: adenylosuccinate synthetase, partial [Acidimicrobiales bacterium]|nr:adenylosuccinate synthetase [Acidimicrobiales bacterium]